jgi:hypothetical protein
MTTVQKTPPGPALTQAAGPGGPTDSETPNGSVRIMGVGAHRRSSEDSDSWRAVSPSGATALHNPPLHPPAWAATRRHRPGGRGTADEVPVPVTSPETSAAANPRRAPTAPAWDVVDLLVSSGLRPGAVLTIGHLLWLWLQARSSTSTAYPKAWGSQSREVGKP